MLEALQRLLGASGQNIVARWDSAAQLERCLRRNAPDVADIDPDQTGVNLEAGGGDDVKKGDIIVCISDHEDSGQNEPHEQAANGEVAATNRPIIQPTLAALGVSAIEPLNIYKLGFGYSIERWYRLFELC